MKINSNSIRPGNFIKHKGEIYLSLKTQHTQPGKGGAYIQTELRNIRNGIKINERFRSNQSVEKIIINKKTAQFLFNNKEKYIFMDNENFEQISIPKALIGKKNIYLQNNTNVTINIYKENIISINIPESITIQIKSTPSGPIFIVKNLFLR